MPKGIIRSVGKSGSNEFRDVKLVQIYLNSFIKMVPTKKILVEDGLIGNSTINAIKDFQKKSVGMNNPDGRVDPDGKTFRYLTLYFNAPEQDKIEQSIQKGNTTTQFPQISPQKIQSKAGLNNLSVIYNGVLESRKIVSSYSMDVIKLALKESGMECAAITSTLRTPEEQAKIMLKNAKKDLPSQYRLYGSRGDAVLKVYAENKSKADNEIISLMVNKINEFSESGQRVSKHCVSIENYKKLNIFDIGVNSTRAVCKSFNMTKFTKALENLVADGYIENLIDETKKSNSCWHIEIKPNIKSIPNYNKGSILFPMRLISGRYMLC